MKLEFRNRVFVFFELLRFLTGFYKKKFRAKQLYNESSVPEAIDKLSKSNRLAVRSDIKIYADIGNQIIKL